MIPIKSFFSIFILLVYIQLEMISNVLSQSSNFDGSESAFIPLLPSGKRQHNILRFGKRLSPQHSFLSFGKRADDHAGIPEIWKYLQSPRDISYKRGHNIMRFGKRGESSHNFIRFGKRDEDYEDYYPYFDDYDNDDDLDEEKRTGHTMMPFGKRKGHSILSFGKRKGHSMMSFGKRNGHSMMYFGKRIPDELKRAAHAMMHFGKRDEIFDNDEQTDRKRNHAMMHFGKRDEADFGENKKSHAMLHFGKRGWEELYPLDIDSEMAEKRFGKNSEGVRKGTHSMIHFGKRDQNDKRPHAMMHFGKRSVDENENSLQNSNVSSKEVPQETSKIFNRVKRDVTSDSIPLESMMNYELGEADNDEPYYLNGFVLPKGNYLSSEELPNSFEEPDMNQDIFSNNSDIDQFNKRGPNKNVFLHFG